MKADNYPSFHSFAVMLEELARPVCTRCGFVGAGGELAIHACVNQAGERALEELAAVDPELSAWSGLTAR